MFSTELSMYLILNHFYNLSPNPFLVVYGKRGLEADAWVRNIGVGIILEDATVYCIVTAL